MTLAVGDKVRFKGDPEDAAAHPALSTDKVYEVSRVYDQYCVALRGYGARAVSKDRLEKIEEEPRPLGLSAGDKVVNIRTGREGLVLKGPISGELKVYDTKAPIRDAVPAQALEEYEFHHPGTYDVWRRVTRETLARKVGTPW